MKAESYQVGSRGFWAVTVIFFLVLCLILQIGLGSMFGLAVFFTLAYQRLLMKIDPGLGEPDAERRVLRALYSGLVICAAIFIITALLNIGARTIDNDWRWFQLP